MRIRLKPGHFRTLYFTILATCLATPAFSQNPPPQSPVLTDAEWRRQMESRVQQLERENAELRAQKSTDARQAVQKDAESRSGLVLESGEQRLTTPDFFDVNKYVSEGDFPGSFRIPGAQTSFQIGGYVQLDAIFDSDRIGNKDAFVVSSIPTSDDQTGLGDKTGAGNSNFSIRQTRLFLKTQTPTNTWGNLVTYIEVDFMGTDGAEPRVRHIYGQIGDTRQLLVGQTWSAFQDATIFPATLDSQGPAGIVNSRRPQIRVRRDWDKQWTGVLAIEDPSSDISVAPGVAGQNSTPYPDLAGNLRWSPAWGHLQLGGVARYVQFDPDSGSRASELGYGVNLTGSVKTIKLDEKHVDSMVFQTAVGNGIARYVNDTNGLGLDAVQIAPGDDLDGLHVFAGVLGYMHWWNPQWGSTICYSIVCVENASGQDGSAYHSGQYGVLNLRYYPAERVMLGGEVLYGIRENNDGSTGDDVRLQFSAQYRF